MSPQEIINLQNEIGNSIFDNAPDDWRIFRINIEMLFDNEELVTSSTVFYCYKGDLLYDDLDYQPSDNFDEELNQYFLDLNNICLIQQGSRWSICDFVMSNTGQLKVNFSYEIPPRLSGDLLSGKDDARPSIKPYL